jgi:aspartyl/glutamyl-tRNA(Asn/Gln) amidotransferase B subunit
VNSIRFIGQAIEYEARRQIDVIEDGGTIKQETRLFDAKSGKTRPMRSKEEAHDYRYFPDPDLLPLEVSEAFVEDLKKVLPELPDEKRARFMSEYALSAYDAGVLILDRASADFYETVAKGRDPKLAANWMMGDFFAALNKTGKDITESPISATQLGELIDLISSDVISGRIAKEVFEIMLEKGGTPAAIVEERGLKQVTDTGAIEKVVDEIIAANPKQVEHGAEPVGRHRAVADALALLVQAAEQFVDHPVRGLLRFAALYRRLEIIRSLALGHEHIGVVSRKAEGFDEARALLVRKLRQIFGEPVHIVLAELERQKVRVGEIAVVMRLFL